MPEVLGALIVGVVLGPVVLNLVEYDSNIRLVNGGTIKKMYPEGCIFFSENCVIFFQITQLRG